MENPNIYNATVLTFILVPGANYNKSHCHWGTSMRVTSKITFITPQNRYVGKACN